MHGWHSYLDSATPIFSLSTHSDRILLELRDNFLRSASRRRQNWFMLEKVALNVTLQSHRSPHLWIASSIVERGFQPAIAIIYQNGTKPKIKDVLVLVAVFPVMVTITNYMSPYTKNSIFMAWWRISPP
ncbi:unknown protein [Microcystis aeruginosa NIES-843]|uniref:Uncharacterized protein n=1 Tax=Microcystis aeruginosa (strain NIES-843 / IAM M-2473) TaxID=449447 RepID=B0JSZ0_MICAN|nr:unknown protein [Microcystis aeruginosa NIES-843]